MFSRPRIRPGLGHLHHVVGVAELVLGLGAEVLELLEEQLADLLLVQLLSFRELASAAGGANGGEDRRGDRAGAGGGEGELAGAVVVGQGLAGGQVAAGAVDPAPGGTLAPAR